MGGCGQIVAVVDQGESRSENRFLTGRIQTVRVLQSCDEDADDALVQVAAVGVDEG